MRAQELVKKKTKYLNSIHQAVQEIRYQVPEAEEIWLHGSRARGDNRVTSDIDILVLVPNTVRGKEYVDIVIKLQQLAQKLNPVAAAQYKTIDFDIQPARYGNNIYQIAQEEGQRLWSRQATAQ